MEARNRWGVVYVAVLFAVIAIGTALTTHWVEGEKGVGGIVASAKSLVGWQSVSSVPGAEPATPAADTLSNDLYSGYLGIAQDGIVTAAEKNQLLAGIVEKDIQPQNVVPPLTKGQLNIVATTSVDNYISLVALILNESAKIKKDESYLFANTVQNDITTGTPALINAANLYERIATALFIMEVPPAVATEHLELVKSTAAMSNVIRNMGTWRGDTVEALADIDTFNKARAYADNSATVLAAAVQNLQAQKKP